MDRILPASALAFALAAALSGTIALAQSTDGERAQQMQAEMQKRFAAADANGDGRLTRDEAKGKMPFVYKHFDEIDTTHSGSVSMAEISAFARMQRGARKTAN
jgi:hypothetical protein